MQSKQSVLTRNHSKILGFQIHRKKFIQPFEQILARQELLGLGLNVLSVDEKSNIFSVSLKSKKLLRTKLSKLAYFDWLITDHLQPTIQACRERAKPSAQFSDDPSFPNRRILRFGPHALHEYRGKYFPQLVRSLCNISGLERGDKVLDPMCGSGTTIVEARAMDLHAFGIDLNPLSILITIVKADSIGWSKEVIEKTNNSIEFILRKKTAKNEYPWNENDQNYLNRWFAKNTLDEISILIKQINTITDESIRKFALVCFSDIIRTVSFQKNDELRVRRQVRTTHNGECVELFRKKVKTSLKSISYLNRVDPQHTMPYDVKDGDARSLDIEFSRYKGKFDAIITSPPYATALPYLDTDRLSLIILGLLPHKNHPLKEFDMIGSREITERQRQSIWEDYLKNQKKLPSSITHKINGIADVFHGSDVGFRRRNLPSLLAKYFFDMKNVFEQIKKMLKSDSYAYVVVGNNSTMNGSKKINIPTDEFLEDIAKQVGFKILPEINMELLSSRDIFKKNRGSKEKIIRLVNS